MSTIVVLFMVTVGAVGCASTNEFKLVDPTQPTPTIKAYSLVYLNEVEGQGKGDVSFATEANHAALASGFSFIDSRVRESSDRGISDAILDVSISTDRSLSALDYPKMIPVFGQYFGLIGASLSFHWTALVDFKIEKPSGEEVTSGSFEIEGSGNDSPNFGERFTAFIGAWLQLASYPDAEQESAVSLEIATLAGQEIGQRLRSGPAAEYLVARTLERDGMGPAAYQKYSLAKKELQDEARLAAAKDEQMGVIRQVDVRRPVPAGSVFVLGVGVGDYESAAYPSIQNAGLDCDRIVGWFKREYELSDERAVCLRDDEATARRLDRILRQDVPKILGPNDTFVFYFRGHGTLESSRRSGDGDGLDKFLVMADSDPDAIPNSSTSLSGLFAQVGRLNAGRKILLVDASFAGSVAKESVRGFRGLSVSSHTYTNATSISGSGTVVLAASREDQPTVAVDLLDSGTFTHYLLKGLEGAADKNGDKEVDILELHQFVNGEVSARTGGKQTPVFRGELNLNIVF